MLSSYLYEEEKFACFTREAFVLFIIYYFYFFCKSKWKLKKYILIPKLSLNILEITGMSIKLHSFLGPFDLFLIQVDPPVWTLLLFFNRAGLLTPPKILYKPPLFFNKDLIKTLKRSNKLFFLTNISYPTHFIIYILHLKFQLKLLKKKIIRV